jgi:hypothetical protein
MVNNNNSAIIKKPQTTVFIVGSDAFGFLYLR